MSAYSENSYTVYRSVVLKNNSLWSVDIIFINKLQFLIFSFLWFTRLNVKCMDSMFPCYSLLNMKIIWFLIWQFSKNFWGQYFFLHHLWQNKPLLWELKIYGGVMFITTLSLIHFFRNSQHPEKWSVSRKNSFKQLFLFLA